MLQILHLITRDQPNNGTTQHRRQRNVYTNDVYYFLCSEFGYVALHECIVHVQCSCNSVVFTLYYKCALPTKLLKVRAPILSNSQTQTYSSRLFIVRTICAIQMPPPMTILLAVAAMPTTDHRTRMNKLNIFQSVGEWSYCTFRHLPIHRVVSRKTFILYSVGSLYTPRTLYLLYCIYGVKKVQKKYSQIPHFNGGKFVPCNLSIHSFIWSKFSFQSSVERTFAPNSI